MDPEILICNFTNLGLDLKDTFVLRIMSLTAHSMLLPLTWILGIRLDGYITNLPRH